jgi:hypothetical protein
MGFLGFTRRVSRARPDAGWETMTRQSEKVVVGRTRPSGGHARDEPWTHQDALEGVDVVFAHHTVDVDRVDGAPVHARASRLERERGRRV